MERRPSIEAVEGEGERPERAEDNLRFGVWRILEVPEEDERGDDWSHTIFNGRWKTRGGGSPYRYR